MTKDEIKYKILNSDLKEILEEYFRIDIKLANTLQVYYEFSLHEKAFYVLDQETHHWIILNLTDDELDFLKLKCRM